MKSSNFLLNVNRRALVLVIAMVAFTLETAVAMQKKSQETNIYIPRALSPYFERIPGEVQGAVTGWLQVPGEGQVWIKLIGKSFTRKNFQPKDYSIRYIGHDTNGCIRELPKGLFYWRKASTVPGSVLGDVKPAKDSKYGGQIFDYAGGASEHFWHLFNDKQKHWNARRSKHRHPSKEISDLIHKL